MYVILEASDMGSSGLVQLSSRSKIHFPTVFSQLQKQSLLSALIKMVPDVDYNTISIKKWSETALLRVTDSTSAQNPGGTWLPTRGRA